MLVTVVTGLLTTFGLGLALSLVFFAIDEEPQEQNLRALRERAEAAAAAHADLRGSACDDLKVAA